MRNHLILSALGLSMLVAAPALAADDWASGNRLNVPQGEWLAFADQREAERARLQGA